MDTLLQGSWPAGGEGIGHANTKTNMGARGQPRGREAAPGDPTAQFPVERVACGAAVGSSLRGMVPEHSKAVCVARETSLGHRQPAFPDLGDGGVGVTMTTRCSCELEGLSLEPGTSHSVNGSTERPPPRP